MRFDSLYFLFFFLAIFGLSRVRHIGSVIYPGVYIAASFLFYIVAGWKDLALILSLIILNYGASFIVRRRLVLPAVIILNLGTLVFFKYSAFLSASFLPQDIFNADIIIPLGISFYVFQMIAYQVDLVRGHCNFIQSFPKFFLFIGFFPQLVAGPIVRASQLTSQIDRLFSQGARKNIIYSLGVGLCLLGLIKKVILSDSIAPLVDDAFLALPMGAIEAWNGILLFGFQIYYDFSGYSDIALGLAYLLGFRLPINFRQPYLAKSPQEFWQRWHITLSTWIRDYLYIPLGGSKVGGRLAQLAVLLFVMSVMGLWHGANWTFALWGIGWGLAIALWRFGGGYLNKVPMLSWFLTMMIAFTLWVFFRAPDISFAIEYIKIMFSFNFSSGAISLWGILALVLLGIFHSVEGKFYNIRGVRFLKRKNTAFYLGLLGGLCVLILILPKMLDNPFIYFRF